MATAAPMKRWQAGGRSYGHSGHMAAPHRRPWPARRADRLATAATSFVLVEDTSELNGSVAVLEVPPGAEDASEVLHGARGLLLGDPPTLQGIYRPLGAADFLTYQYWDVFIALPPVLPAGPIAIYGLGAGTIVRLLMESYEDPPIMCGWEADDKVLWAADMAMGLRDMQASGCLQVSGWLAGWHVRTACGATNCPPPPPPSPLRVCLATRL
jgi:hypothetical protein